MKTKIKPDERVQHVVVLHDLLHLFLRDGRHLLVPLDWFPKLHSANAEQLSKWEVTGGGFVIRWPEIDEDLEITGLLAGNAAPERRAAVEVESVQIREYRHRANLSQAELAEELGVRQATISDWEKGKSSPSPLAANRLTQSLRKLELAAASDVEGLTYGPQPWHMSLISQKVGNAFWPLSLNLSSGLCYMMCHDNHRISISLEDCTFTDLDPHASGVAVGPWTLPRFNPTNQMAVSWASAHQT